MGYYLTAKQLNKQITTFYYPDKRKFDPERKSFLRSLGVSINDNTETTKVFSKGDLLKSKSIISTLSNMEGEITFLDQCLEVTNGNKTITITFN